MQEDQLTLFELNSLIKGAIKQSLSRAYWITAEISELKINYSGHCYLELVEKNPEGETLKAKARATIWASSFRMIQPYFETTTRTKLTAGLKVLVKASVDFHELYGLSLNITDIEPSYTIGELALQKQEVINRLIKEGVLDLNKDLPFPRLPKKIAVISSETAAGYGDFKNQLIQNPAGFKFYIKLFPAFMQGEEAETSIVNAMEKVFRFEHFFDVLIIIRGGGAQSDLSCFNGYWLSSHIAQFPIPVLTGIGHEQDETVADAVAHTRLKTPTAVAEFLIEKYQEEESIQYEMASSLADASRDVLNLHTTKLMKYAYAVRPLVMSVVERNRKKLAVDSIRIKNSAHTLLSESLQKYSLMKLRLGSVSKQYFMKSGYRISTMNNNLKKTIPAFLKHQLHRLEMLGHKNNYNDPQQILKRGYSVTLFRGKVVKSAAELKGGDLLDTLLHEGKVKSRVTDEY